MKLLTPAKFNSLLSEALIIDTRIPDLFERSFIPNSINIGSNGSQQEWLSKLVETDRKILLVTAANKEEETMQQFVNWGFTGLVGVLKGGFEAWQKAKMPIDMVISITPEEFLADLRFLEEREKVIDLRTPEEHKAESIPNTLHIPLDQLPFQLPDLDKNLTYYLFCGGGYRSMIGASLLKKMGFMFIKNVYGGFTRISAEKNKISV